MTFAEKLKSIRKQAGIPGIENIMAVSALFDISIDELLSNENRLKRQTEYLNESITAKKSMSRGERLLPPLRKEPAQAFPMRKTENRRRLSACRMRRISLS